MVLPRRALKTEAPADAPATARVSSAVLCETFGSKGALSATSSPSATAAAVRPIPGPLKAENGVLSKSTPDLRAVHAITAGASRDRIPETAPRVAAAVKGVSGMSTMSVPALERSARHLLCRHLWLFVHM